MTPEQWTRIKELFNAALEKPEAERATFLDETCGSDTALRDKIQQLLADQDCSELQSPVAGILERVAEPTFALHGTIGHYRVEAKLGEGGMGVVYRAYDTQLHRPVALKVLPSEHAADPERHQRLIREARAASALNHPNIITVYDIQQTDGIDLIAMEYVEGKTLDALIGRKGLKLNEALRYAIQIADAMAKAHAAGIVHRDLKPGNVMVTAEGRVKVLDFGLAKLTEAAVNPEDSARMEQASAELGAIVGTVSYMSPEQAEGKKVDARSDIFSFGAVLYEMLTGKRAFRRESQALTLAAIQRLEPPPLPAGIPQKLERVVARCLRKDPARRFQHMGDVKVELEELKEESDLGQLGRAGSSPAKRPRWLWAAGLAVLAVLAAIMLYLWQAQRPAGPFARVEPTRLTDSGKATAAAISPDGKYVAHAVADGVMSILSLRNAATGSNVPMLPPVQGTFSNLQFSHDGNVLYYVFDTGTPPSTLYMMPVPSGDARKLAPLANTMSVRVSPDEKRLVFIRFAGAAGSVLSIAKVDGAGERQVASRQWPEDFGLTDWSPDGKTLAYSIESYRGGYSHYLAAMPAEGGGEKRIGTRTWGFISAVRWMPDGHGLMILASEHCGGGPVQLWYVSYPGGATRRITNDVNEYSDISLTGDASALVTVQNDYTTGIWTGSSSEVGSIREITRRLRTNFVQLDWAGNGSIVFTAPDSTYALRLWITAADGTSQRQLTTEGAYDAIPSACGEGRIVFLSSRGTANAWTSDLDGNNARKLTNGEGEFGASCSPDGTWLTYGSADPKTGGVWRMPIDGGPPARIWNEYGWTSVSPDGTLVLVDEWSGVPSKVRIIPATGGQLIRSFDLGMGNWRWSADSKSLLFWKTSGGVSNVWRQPLDGGEARQVTNFQSDVISDVAESRDGKKLAVARYSVTSDVVMIRDLK